MRVQSAPRQDMTIKPEGGLYRVERKVKPEQRLQGLEKLVEDGRIAFYNEQDDRVVIYAPTREAADLLALAEQPDPARLAQLLGVERR